MHRVMPHGSYFVPDCRHSRFNQLALTLEGRMKDSEPPEWQSMMLTPDGHRAGKGLN